MSGAPTGVAVGRLAPPGPAAAASGLPAPVRVRAGLARRLAVLPDDSRAMGVSVWATRGAGKSRLLGRLIAWQDFVRGVPLVVLDPIGGTIDNFLDKVARRPYAERLRLWPRIRYVNMSGQDGRVIGWPIYYRAFPGERASSSAQRYVDVLTRADPDLARAPVQGLNALVPLATAAGVILTALGSGITEAWSLVTEPARWQDRLHRLATEQPDTAGAVAELHALYALSARERETRTATFKSKLALFRFAPNFRAIFGASTPGIGWPQVLADRQAVLVDFRDIHSPQVKKFCLLWVYNSLVTFIKQRGHGRHPPLSFVIDELSYLVGSAAVNTDLLNADIDELINRISRSHRIWLTLAGQELFQLPDQLRHTVLSAGAVLFGRTSDSATAEDLAARYYLYDPYQVKKVEPVYGSVDLPGMHFLGAPKMTGVVGERTSEFTRDEQNYRHSRAFLTVPAGHFLLGCAGGEGELPTALTPIATTGLDPGHYPDTDATARLRAELTRRDGRPEHRLLTEISARLAAPPSRAAPAAPTPPPEQAPPRAPDREPDRGPGADADPPIRRHYSAPP